MVINEAFPSSFKIDAVFKTFARLLVPNFALFRNFSADTLKTTMRIAVAYVRRSGRKLRMLGWI